MLTQLDDDGWEFVVAYVNRSNNKMENIALHEQLYMHKLFCLL
jgi:hypothetical protein